MDKKVTKVISVILAALTLVTLTSVAAFAQTPAGITRQRPNNEEMVQHREEVQVAIQANDYDAWAELTKDRPVADQITEANFGKFVEAHKYMENARAEMEKAKTIFEELGLKRPMGKMQGQQGMKKGMRPNRQNRPQIQE